MTTAPDYYKKIISCKENCPEVLNCNVNKTLEPRWLPRGTTTRCKPGKALLMVILDNPGTPQEIEDTHYQGKSESELADVAWQFTEAVLEYNTSKPNRMGAGTSPTHRNLMRHLAEHVFDCPKEEVLDKVVVTNHVRCSTEVNFSDITDKLDIGTTCVEKHLIDEINYWKPKMIVVCGTPAKETLDDLKNKNKIRFTYKEVRHPTARGKYIKERIEQFIEIGKKIKSFEIDKNIIKEA